MRLSIRQYALALLDIESELDVEKATEAGKNFYAWLIQRGEAKKVRAIVTETERIVKERKNVVCVTLTTAHVSDASVEAVLTQQAQKFFSGKHVATKFVTDARLIGGVRIQSEEVLYDATLMSALKSLRQSLEK